MDPVLAGLLRELWMDPRRRTSSLWSVTDEAGSQAGIALDGPPDPPAPAPAEGGGAPATAATERRKSQARRAEREESIAYPDVLSSLWRMLEGYDQFVCSPPGFHAFRQVQQYPHTSVNIAAAV